MNFVNLDAAKAIWQHDVVGGSRLTIWNDADLASRLMRGAAVAVMYEVYRVAHAHDAHTGDLTEVRPFSLV